MSNPDFSPEQTGSGMRRRGVIVGAVAGALSLLGGGWALSEAGLFGSGTTTSGKELDLKKKANPAPADQPTGTSKRTPDPMGAQFAAVAKAAMTELSSKLGVSPDKIAAAMEKVGPQVKPTQAEMGQYKLGSPTEQSQIRIAVGNRWLSAMSAELGVDRAVLKTAVNEVKDDQFTTNQALIKAAFARAVSEGHLTAEQSATLLTALREERIGG